MKKILFAALFAGATARVFAQTNVGIGTNTPTTKLQVAGAISATTSSAPAATTVVIPDNVTNFDLTSGTGPSTLSVAHPQDGQFLIIQNDDVNPATFTTGTSSSVVIPAGGMASFLYLAADLKWQEIATNNTGSNAFTAGTGLGWSGTTLNSSWTASGSNLYPSSTSALVGIGNASPGNNLLNVFNSTAASSGVGAGINLQGQNGAASNAGGAVNITAGNSGAGTNIAPANIVLQPGTGTNAQGLTIPGSVGIGNPTPDTAAILDIASTTQGFLPPRMTTTQRNNITANMNAAQMQAAQGLTIFNITDNCLESFIGTSWQPIGCGCTSAPATPGLITYTPGGSTICQGYNNFVFSVPEVAGASTYTWTIPSGASVPNGIGNNSSITLNFSNTAATGTQPISVTASNSCGTSGSSTANITVNAIPVITSPPSSATICAVGGTGNTGDVIFSVSASGTNLQYQWQVNTGSGWNNLANGGVYTNVSASFTGTSTTTSNLTITGATTAYNGYQYQCIISGICSPTVTTTPVTLTVNPLPVVSNLTLTTCSGVAFSITPVSSISGTTYSWSSPSGSGFTNGASASGQSNVSGNLTNSSATALATAVYTVTPTSPTTPTNCAGSTFTVTVTIVPNIVLTTAPTALSTTSCYNTTQPAVTLGTTAGGGNFTFTWSNATNYTGAGSGGTNVTSIPSFTSTDAGNTTTVTDAINVTPIYTVNTVSCPSTPVSSYFSYYVNPVPAINVSLTPTVCTGVGPGITLATQATPTADVTYAWNAGTLSGVTCSTGCTGTASPFNPVLAVTSTAVGTGTYSITPTFTYNTKACAGTASTATVTVVPSPALATAPSAASLTTCGANATQAAISLGTTATGGSGSFTFNWSTSTNNTGVGTAGMSGNNVTSIPSFTTLNSANTAIVTDAINVTPIYTVNGHSCTGTAVSSYMSYVVNPVPAINVSLTPTICNNTATSITLATQATPAGDNSYAWNAGTLNGVTCSGGCTGTSSSFAVTLGNSNTIEGTAVYSITPTFTNNIACAGSASTATITVEPTITIPGAPLATTVCTGVAANITLSSSATGTGTSSYAWNAGTLSGTGCVSGCTGTSSPFNADLSVTTSTAVGTGTYSVTPTYTLNSKACAGTAATVTVTVVPSPVLTTAPTALSLTSCGANATQAAVTLGTTATGGSGTFTFNWSTSTNNTGVGTAGMSGSGVTSIPSFTTLNSANTTTVTDAINVTPIYTVNSHACTGTPVSSYMSYVVNPIPAINVSLTPTVCSSTAVSLTLGTQTTPTADVTYSWNAGTLSGVGCISGCTGSGVASTFNPDLSITSGSTAVGTGTYSITPTFTYNTKACAGSASTATVTVVPLPALTTAPAAASLTTCKGSPQAAITLGTTATGGSGTFTFNWATSGGTNNTGVGTGASGVTSIPSFTSTNSANTTTVTDAINVTAYYTVNSQSCSTTSASYMSYYANPIPAINVSLTPTTCSGTAVSLALGTQCTPTADVTYSWNAGTLTGAGCTAGCTGSGVASIFNPNLSVTTSTVNGSGSYSITPTFTFQTVGCAGSASTATVTVDAPSSAGSFVYANPYGVNNIAGTAGELYDYTAGVVTPLTNGESITGQVGSITGWGWGTNTSTCSANALEGYAGNNPMGLNCCWPHNAANGTDVISVEVTNGQCTGVWNCITVNDNNLAIPTSGSVTPSSCTTAGSSTIALTCSGGNIGTVPGGSYKWYSGSCGGTLVGTGQSLTISNPGATTNYYVQAFDVYGNGSGCYGPITFTHITAGANSVTFNNPANNGTASNQWTVPCGITSVTIAAYGAQGGSNYYPSAGGYGGEMKASFSVTSGTVLNIYVGGQGQGYSTGSAGGTNGGGNGGTVEATNGTYTGGGGGASDVRIGGTALSNRIIVGGGGGGSGTDCYSTNNPGGPGGASTTAAGAGYDCGTQGTQYCGSGGTQTAGGAASTNFVCGSAGTAGSSSGLTGGNGATCWGGGGGGGYFGGGGGGNGGGGGGSNYMESTGSYIGTSITNSAGVQSGNGQVIITY